MVTIHWKISFLASLLSISNFIELNNIKLSKNKKKSKQKAHLDFILYLP